MDIKDKVVVVTGAAAGIGRALCSAFAAQGARTVVCADIDANGAEETAFSINGIARTVDVSHEAEIANLIADVEQSVGPIDIFCSNAGVLVEGGADAPDADWQRLWDINVMAHVWAARHVVPRMIERGGGYLLNTASAAGLLNQIGSAPYGVTKHAAVGLAEWLAITHGDAGIKVSVLCPQAVRTAMTEGHEDHVAAIDGMLEPADAANACIDAIRSEAFLVLPHANVRKYMQLKTADYDRWIAGMQKLNRAYSG
ncbi:SDR family oxidoreductase [Tateyamaria sp. ANG-S1]|uniref:SDR family oxidoreductase n=1 Tax=Tateyamaria sp. ANG-S1 TaxID=1577905 RepID=UPI00057F424B|nr:SDR family oxidoreductase [Tateyamaria sp. ANG-S1]KIC48823.1 short-chain dehydrogenase [Tateyamaria sp. ANG-S1]